MGDAPPKYSPFNGHDDEKVVGFGGCPIFGQAHVNLKVAIGGFEPTIFVTPQNGHDMEKMTMAGTELRPCRPFKMRAAIWRGHGHFCTSPTLITLKVDTKISHPNGK